MTVAQIKKLFSQWLSNYAIWILAVVLAGFMAIYWDVRSTPPPSTHAPESPETAATYIPAGYVLVPIEVANFESLDSILGKFGVVDLYIPSSDGKKRPIKVAERIKILRAPLNPSHFAVLAPESESQRLVAHDGAFIVVVQNPAKSGTKFVNRHSEDSRAGQTGTRKRPRSRIQVEVTDAEDS